MPSAAFVINQTRLRDPGWFVRRCRVAARAAGWEPLFAETSAADGGFGPACWALASGASLVFAAGGDGTVRACAQALAGTGTPLAIIPLGTANLTARALGIPAQVSRAPTRASAAGTGRSTSPSRAWAMRIQTARVLGSGGAGRDRLYRHGRHRTGCGGGGGGRRAAQAQARLGGLRRVRAQPPVRAAGDFTIRLDGGEPLRRRARCVVVGNGGRCRAGSCCCPGPGWTTGGWTWASSRPRACSAGRARRRTCSPAAGVRTGTLAAVPGAAGGDQRGGLPAAADRRGSYHARPEPDRHGRPRCADRAAAEVTGGLSTRHGR